MILSTPQSQSSKPEKKRLGAGRVAFLARKEVIKEKIEAGYTAISVFRSYKNQLGIGYGQFSNYVRTYIRSKPDENESNIKPESGSTATGEYYRHYLAGLELIK